MLTRLFTSQICSCCGHKDKASRSKEKFICTNCGHHADADYMEYKEKTTTTA
ncbi:MAG: zinc ribbon domain-containing protein [Cyanobacteria bacterium J06643_5]